jgi:HK97 gp10 family phage protein
MNVSLEKILDIFTAVRNKLTDKTRMLQNLGTFVAGEVDQNFRQRGRPRWAGNRPLVKTGRMKREAVTTKVEGDRVTVGQGLGNVTYASFIQFGTRKMTARPFMDVPELAAGAVKTIREWIFGG